MEKSTGVVVLTHSVKKPGCGDEIMAYFRRHPETGVTRPDQVAVVGDRLATDMMLANMMGSWGFWVRDGVVPLREKSVVRIVTVAMSLLQLLTHDPVLETRPEGRLVVDSPRIRAA